MAVWLINLFGRTKGAPYRGYRYIRLRYGGMSLLELEHNNNINWLGQNLPVKATLQTYHPQQSVNHFWLQSYYDTLQLTWKEIGILADCLMWQLCVLTLQISCKTISCISQWTGKTASAFSWLLVCMYLVFCFLYRFIVTCILVCCL